MPDPLASVAPREREVLELLLAHGESSAGKVEAALDDVSNSAVRSMLSRLQVKGLVARRRDGQRYVYRATAKVRRAGERELGKVLRAFFGGSPGQAVLTLLGRPDVKMTETEIEQLEELLRRARSRLR